MTKPDSENPLFRRREFLKRMPLGMGALAIAPIAGQTFRFQDPRTGLPAGVSGLPHIQPKIKRVIFLCMAGGPSQFETFDYKPKLAAMDGKPMPVSFTKGQPIAQLQGQQLKCLGPLAKFQKYGQNGQEISDFLPFTAKLADDICILRGMQTDQINHDPAHTVMNTGTSISGRPSMGSWVTYALGSSAEDLPGFVILTSRGGRNPQPINSRQWHNGFLPGTYQGVPFHSTGDPVHYVENPPGINQDRQEQTIRAVRSLNELRNRAVNNPEIVTRNSQYELALRMQTSIPELMDFRNESAATLDMYGTQGADGSYAANCLLARRLAERGVRFIHLYHRGWDHHGDLVRYMNTCCGLTDKPTWALITDLKQRGLLKDTLVIWGGEFGRTPMFQGKGKEAGRDHHIRSFSMWLAGGGIRGGMTYGKTDELGYNAVEEITHVHDLHATMLHLLGIDHKRLTYRFQGRDFRLTDVKGRLVHEILT